MSKTVSGLLAAIVGAGGIIAGQSYNESILSIAGGVLVGAGVMAVFFDLMKS